MPISGLTPNTFTPHLQQLGLDEKLHKIIQKSVMLNNLDTLRSYGSAGDELENVPADYARNLNRSAPQGCAGEYRDSEKATWADRMQMAASLAEKNKGKNDYKVSSPVNCDVPNRLYGGRSNTINNIKMNGTVNVDDDQRNLGTDSYIRHPNTYLPAHGYNITGEADTDGPQSPGADSDDVEPYGFPSNRNRRRPCEDDAESVITTLDSASCVHEIQGPRRRIAICSDSEAAMKAVSACRFTSRLGLLCRKVFGKTSDITYERVMQQVPL
nr:unnamed protein product [Callosobruchus chinensis]